MRFKNNGDYPRLLISYISWRVVARTPASWLSPPSFTGGVPYRRQFCFPPLPSPPLVRITRGRARTQHRDTAKLLGRKTMAEKKTHYTWLHYNPRSFLRPCFDYALYKYISSSTIPPVALHPNELTSPRGN